MQQKRSSTTYKRKELLFEAQNTSETYVFLASPPQAPKNFKVLPPHISRPRGGNFFIFPPSWGGKSPPQAENFQDLTL